MLYTQTDQEIASERLDTAVTYRIALGGGTAFTHHVDQYTGQRGLVVVIVTEMQEELP